MDLRIGNLAVPLIIFAVWLIAQLVILPRLGVST